MSEKTKLVEICRKVYREGFVSATDGNISVVTKNNNFLITRSGINKGDVTEDDILEIDSSGKIISGRGKLSTEFKIHLFAYSRRPEVFAVVHCHPVYATAFASTGQGFYKHVFPEVILSLGKVPLCSYAAPSTDELALSMQPYIDYAWAFLLQNHGAVTLGRDPDDAYNKMEKLEHTAKTIFAARLLGGEKEITPDKVRELLKLASETYGIMPDERNIF
jgi:L-fuculose-phosphate aldolase